MGHRAAIPTTRCFWTSRAKTGIKLILFATPRVRSRRHRRADRAAGQLRDLPRDEQRDYRVAAARTAHLTRASPARSSWPSTTTQRLYVYELQPDWYEEFLTIDEEIVTSLSDDDLDEDEPLGGYFSKN